MHAGGELTFVRRLQVSGSTRLSELVQDIWTPDVKANQLADVISGIAPVRSVVNVGSGVANLVLLPYEQYRKDGRIVRGLQKGASAFAKQTTLEALNVGARLATGTQVILEQAEAVLGVRPSAPIEVEADAATATLGGDGQMITMLSEEERVALISRYAEQPGDLREGMESAYRSLGDNFRSAAQTILAVPMEVYERSGTEVSAPSCEGDRLGHGADLRSCRAGSRSCRCSRCAHRRSQAHDWCLRGRLKGLVRLAQHARSRRPSRGERQVQAEEFSLVITVPLCTLAYL